MREQASFKLANSHNPRVFFMTSSRMGGLLVIAFLLTCSLTVIQQILQTPRTSMKLAHCRPDLPGCVPKVIEYIAFVHIPKAGGNTIGDFLAHHSRDNLCPMTELWPQNYCDGLYSPEGMQNTGQCQLQRLGLQKLQNIHPFDKFHCDTIAGRNHLDFGLIDALRPDVLERTLVIVNLRRPYDRVVSTYNYLLHQDNTGIFKIMGLRKFAEQGAQGEDTNNRMTKTLAGDYCCYAQPLSDCERWNKALYNLQNRVGVVTLLEDMESSLGYISWLMGWDAGKGAMKSNANPHPVLDPDIEAALKNANTFDAQLYHFGRIQFSNQILAMIT